MPQGRKPGGPKTGGRQTGTPNKRTQEIGERLAEMGCDPLEGMARIAMDEKHSSELRGRMFAELAHYVYPKRKAVELSGPGGESIDLELIARLRAGRERARPESAKREN